MQIGKCLFADDLIPDEIPKDLKKYYKYNPNVGVYTGNLATIAPIEKVISEFVKYQISYLTSHDDIKLEPIVESLVAQMLVDTKMCYLLEIKD